MKTTLSLDEARALVDKYLKSEALRLHSRETEVIMRRLARHFGEDETLWAATGLIHDLDMDAVQGDAALHGKRTVEILREEGYDLPVMFRAILSHIEGYSDNGLARESRLHYALAAAENITGMISAYVLVRPDKKIAGTKVKSITKKLKDKSFAASVNREFIQDIEKTGLERSAFIQMAIDAMEAIAEEIHM